VLVETDKGKKGKENSWKKGGGRKTNGAMTDLVDPSPPSCHASPWRRKKVKKRERARFAHYQGGVEDPTQIPLIFQGAKIPLGKGKGEGVLGEERERNRAKRGRGFWI